MNQSLLHFRTVCREAFAFLISDYGFHEAAPTPDLANTYIVEFANTSVSLRVIGEGYGSVARVEYIDPEGRPVPSAVLDSTWQPGAWRKKAKRAGKVKQSQDDQIRAAAAQIRSRDQDILGRRYERLQEAAVRWQQVLAAYKKKDA